MRHRLSLLTLGVVTCLCGCGTTGPVTPAPPAISSVAPSASGVPNSIATLGNFEFVSVQTTGQIFAYDNSTGTQVQVGTPYRTPCNDPSGMAILPIGAVDVMAVVCYDTGSLLTLTVHSDGSLTALGAVSGLPNPYPGAVLDGTNLFVPLFGTSQAANGGVARVSLAQPANPVITATATLASPVTGGFANPGYLAVSGGFIYMAAGSESAPIDASSTIQVIDEATMTVVGQPFVVPHSPQQIAVNGTIAYVTLYDAAQLEAIDVSDPDNLKLVQTVSLAALGSGCHPIPVAVRESYVYIGCYAEGTIDRLDIQTLAIGQATESLSAISAPQRLLFTSNYLFVPSSAVGGLLYQISLSTF